MERNRKLSISVNAVIAVVVAVALFKMMTGTPDEDSLTVKGISAFKFFTVDSNALIMIAAILFSAWENRTAGGLANGLPKWVCILKLAATTAVTLTMIVTVFFLGPNASEGYFSMFAGSNLFFHLLVPLASIAVFVLLEKTRAIRFADSLWSLLPTALYAAAYAANVFAHAENGKVSSQYDWYGFVRNGTDKALIPVAVLLGASFVISTVLWFANRKGTGEKAEKTEETDTAA